mgnify:CR=1 FL=1
MTALRAALGRSCTAARCKLRLYWQLTKSLQTGLLIVTGVAGFMSARCPLTSWSMLLAVTGSLALAIGGSTILNMVIDRDIDARMQRTMHRPLPTGELQVREALLVGLGASAAGVLWALLLAPLYGGVVCAGLFFDVVVYTLWLKRRTPWSIVWGGIAGGMPVLAGRALGVGAIDGIGLLLALAVLFWIPTHIMTFGIRQADDYARSGVPVFANTHGPSRARLMIAASTMVAVLAMMLACWQLGLHLGCLRLALALGVALLMLTLASVMRPSPKLNFGVFKFASLYMLGAMLAIIAGV